MLLKRVFGSIFCLVMVVTVFSSVSSAQFRTGPLRWLGDGFSDGYHRCNPGPNSDYYNPYSAHNSLLISQSPNAINQLPPHLRRNVQPGVPFSVYAAPPKANEGETFKSLPGEPVDSTFEPYDPQNNKPILDENEGSLKNLESDDNSFNVPKIPGQVEELSPSGNQFDFSKTGYEKGSGVNPDNQLFDPLNDD